MNHSLDLENNLKDILKNDYNLKSDDRIIIVFDLNSKLSKILHFNFFTLSSKLQNEFIFIEFDESKLDEIVLEIEKKTKIDDIVVLIQSNSFRVSKFRWRNELCSIGLKVIEFGHLNKMLDNEIETFISSLTYDYPHYEKLNSKLVPMIKNANEIKIVSNNGNIAKYEGKMDEIILNDGNYEGNTNYGSRYPIGEIVSEALDLSNLNGKIEVYAFPNLSQETEFVEPFEIEIEDGFVISHNGPKNFDELIEMIKTEHPKGKVYVREFGLGTNRHISRMSRLGDPIAYERQEGLHFSLGMKHGIYQKKLWPKYGKKFFQRFHIDVYVNLKELYVDGELVYEQNKGFLV